MTSRMAVRTVEVSRALKPDVSTYVYMYACIYIIHRYIHTYIDII